MSLCCRSTFVSRLTEAVAVNISLSLSRHETVCLSLCRRKKKKEMMSSVSTHLKILQPRSISGPSVHISLDMQALVASFRQTRLAEWYRTFWRVASPSDVWLRSVPELGSSDREIKPSKEWNPNKTTRIISIIFTSPKHCTEFPGAGWGL